MDERSLPPLQIPPSSNAAPPASSAPRIPASVVEYRRSSSGGGSGLHFQYDTPVTARDAVKEIARLREDGTRMLRDLTRSQAEGKRLQIELERAQNDRGVMLVELETARKQNTSLADQARGAVQATQRAEKELQEVRRALHGERARAASAVAAVGRLRDELQLELARRSNRPPQVKAEQMDIELAPPTDKLSSLPPRRPSSVATPPSPSVSIASSAHPTSPRPIRLPSFPSQKHDRPSLSTTSSPSETSSRYLPPASAMAPSSSSDAGPAASSSSSPPGTRSFSLPSLSLPLSSGSPLRPTLTSTNSMGSSPPGPSSAAPGPIVVSSTAPNVEASRSAPLPHQESNHKRKRSHDAVDDAAAGPTPSQWPAPTPVQPQKREPRLGISHLSLLYETRGNKMSCRFCGYSFRLTAAWVALVGHSQSAHADKCAELVALGPAQVLEKSHRLGTGIGKG
ncbi:hypothetical protein GGX14DRAFT_671457 [Mycena pura]|uniref:Uncharacterized protein n=1 Tax=Mycena pura TaxID=153505 RepID=A0AAD6UXT0_9AGAR|nr:hypothetical protein GGX14DRAFT_671457 [Mycena pura]